MSFIILVSLIVFICYYLSCLEYSSFSQKYFFISLFLFTSCFLRFYIPEEINKDYYGYLNKSYSNPEGFLTFLISEPYLYLVFKLFNLFENDRIVIFSFIYWFNFLLVTLFFVWLSMKKDVKLWKKIIIFVFYYFLFGYVVLRNSPVYILFALFCYSSYKNQKFNAFLLTPLMHLSALPVTLIVFFKKKYYLKYLFFLSLLLIPVFVIYIMPLIENLIELQSIVDKANVYSKGADNMYNIIHTVYFIFISLLVFKTLFFDRVFHPIIFTTIGLYYLFFIMNPVLGFRYSPYLFISILLFSNEKITISKFDYYLNRLSLFTMPYFIYTLYDTHFL